VEPSVERGVNLGIHTFKQVLEEYQKALDEWFHHKKDKLQQLLAPDRNRQWNDRFSESLKYSASELDFPDWTLLIQEQLESSLQNAAILSPNLDLFAQHNVLYYRKRVFKVLKEAFMEVFVSQVESRCRKLFGPFSNTMDKKISKVLFEYRQQAEEKLHKLENQLVQLNQAVVETTQKTQTRGESSEANIVWVDITGIVELFWKKWKPCLNNREAVLCSILDSGFPTVISTGLLNRLMLEFPCQGLVWKAQDSLLQYGRLEKLLFFFTQVDPLANRRLLEWLQDTVYLLCCLSDDQLYQLLTHLEALHEYLWKCRENGKWDKRVEHLLKLYSSLLRKNKARNND